MIRAAPRLVPPLMLAAPLLLGGCIGSDYTAFFTNENLGLSVESLPTPNLSLNVGRQEGAIAPSFETGEMSGLLAGSFHDMMTLLPLSWNHGSVFAGGAAAFHAASTSEEREAWRQRRVAEGRDPTPGAACISGTPVGYDGKRLPEGNVSRPLVFATNTSIGLRVALPATAASGLAFPDVNLGYRRQEVALAPLLGQPNGCANGRGYQVNSPNFIAISRAGANLEGSTATTLSGGAFQLGSVFAVGAPAYAVARDPNVNLAIRTAIAAKAQAATDINVETTSEPDSDTSACLDAYVGAVSGAERTKRQVALMKAANEEASKAKLERIPGTNALITVKANRPIRLLMMKKFKADLPAIDACKVTA